MPLQIVHSIRGRLRLRCENGSENDKVLSRVEERVGTEEGVIQVQTNSSSGSVLILYQPEKIGLEKLVDLLAQVSGFSVMSSHSSPKERARDTPDKAAVPNIAKAFQEPLWRLNRQVYELTDGNMDLRYLVPVGFIIYGTLKLYRQGFVPSIPWYLCYWWSYRLFSTFSRTNK